MARIQDDVLQSGIAAIKKFSEEKPRKFTETVELQIGLKNFDPARDRRLAGTVRLPLAPKKNFNLCLLGSAKHCEEAQALGIDHLSEDDLKKFNRNAKLVKKLAKKYDAFLASSTLIKKIPRLLGPGLSKAGKFPTSVNQNDNLGDKVEEVKSMIKYSLKFKAKMPMAMAVPVGNVTMSDEEIASNIIVAVNYCISLCKKNWQNIKRLHIKSTMGPPQRIYGL
jgi:large subunit ribosomal protein L10Ae